MLVKKMQKFSLIAISLAAASASAEINSADKSNVQQLVTEYETLLDRSLSGYGGMSKFYNRTACEDKSICTDKPDDFLHAGHMYTRKPAMDSLAQMYLVVSKLEAEQSFNISTPSTIYLAHALNMGEIYFQSIYNTEAADEDGLFDFDTFKMWDWKDGGDGAISPLYEMRAAAGIARVILLGKDFATDSVIYARSRNLAKELYRHVWRKWTGAGTGETTYEDYLGTNDARATDSLTRGGTVALALAAWSDSLGLPKSDFQSFLRDRAIPAIGKQPTVGQDRDYYINYVRADGSPNYNKRDTLKIEHPASIYDISHAADAVTLATLFEEYPNIYSYGAIANTRYIYNTLKNDIWKSSSTSYFSDYPRIRDEAQVREFHSPIYNYDVHIGTDDFSPWTNSSYKGSLQGGWAKLSKYDSNLRQAYFDMIFSTGGVICWGSDSKRFRAQSSFGSNCNANTVFSQAHLISSLLHAYMNRVD